MRIIAVFLLLLLGNAPAIADEVILKSGGKVTGIVLEEKDGKVVIEISAGTVSFDQDEVLSITRAHTPLHEYKARAEKVSNSRKASDHFAVARYARDNGFGKYERRHLKKVIELDPQHEAARRRLGYTLYSGKWLTQDEVQRERGFVKFEGKWMTQAEIELIRHHRLQQEERRLAMEAERRKREAELAAQRLEWEREKYDKKIERDRRAREQRDRDRTWQDEDYPVRRYYRYPSRYAGPRLPYTWHVSPTFDVYDLLRDYGYFKSSRVTIPGLHTDW